MNPELLEVIRWNRAQAAGAREMAARARAAGRDEGAVLAREKSALFHDQVADRAAELLVEAANRDAARALEARQDAPAALPGAPGADT